MRGLVDTKGEQFAYLQANTVYTLDGEPTGRLKGNYVVDLAGNRVWQVVGDGLYSVDGKKTIGYLTEERVDDH